MKSILLVFMSISAALAGVRELAPNDEREVSAIWQEICGAGRTRSDDRPTLLGNNLIYCKTSTDRFLESKDHNIQLSSSDKAKTQVVFVQPPSIQYRHQLELNGGANPQQKTTIYVLPQKNSHTLQTTINQKGQTQPNKPTVFFLKDNPNNPKTTTNEYRGTRSSNINKSARTPIASATDSPIPIYSSSPTTPVRSSSRNNGGGTGGSGRFRFPDA